MNLKSLNLAAGPIFSSLMACGFLVPHQAFAVECGDRILIPTFLTEELHCPLTVDSPYALTIVGPSGYLRMLGKGKITCDNSLGAGIAGVLVEGLSSFVAGGEVDACPTGIILEGVGSHSILNTKISNSTSDGVEVISDFNFISGSEIIGSGPGSSSTGVAITEGGEYTTISSNFIDDNGIDGIAVRGQNTLVTLNEIVNSGINGLLINAENTTVTNNFISFNLDDGIDIETGFNTMSGNVIRENGEDGIDVDNVVTGNLINNNYVIDSVELGIAIETNAVGNTIKDNTAQGSGMFDLIDVTENAFCTNQLNTWENNTADTSSPDCLKGL
ncbi:right-handed parallel beta-helix repeat-containing protein [Microbulbifer sp. SSSA007]|uniref:right-handed parallel beta-helix repeat-containing protein n=1 Tax=Microbulbifer sp. SSSA007 TaxID=3243379 RepID=UPI00403A7829